MNLVMLLSLALLARCVTGTVAESVESHESEEKRELRMHKLLLKQIHLNSDALGILGFCTTHQR